MDRELHPDRGLVLFHPPHHCSGVTFHPQDGAEAQRSGPHPLSQAPRLEPHRFFHHRRPCERSGLAPLGEERMIRRSPPLTSRPHPVHFEEVEILLNPSAQLLSVFCGLTLPGCFAMVWAPPPPRQTLEFSFPVASYVNRALPFAAFAGQFTLRQ